MMRQLCRRCGSAPLGRNRNWYCDLCATVSARETAERSRQRNPRPRRYPRDLLKLCRDCLIEKPLSQFPRGAHPTSAHRCFDCLAAEAIRPKVRKKPSPPAAPPQRWSAERLRQVAAALAAGGTYRSVASDMCLTKNMVVGAIYRARERGEIDDAGDTAPPPPLIREELLIGGCRFIIGEPGSTDWHWCGQPTVPVFNGTATVKDWCDTHLALVYQRRLRQVSP